MKKLILSLLLLTVTIATKAQYNAGWDSAINFGGGGSTINELRYVNGDLYFVASVIGKYQFAGVNYDSGGGNTPSIDLVFGKITAAGNQVLLLKFKSADLGTRISRIASDGSLIILMDGNFSAATFGNLSIPPHGVKILKIDATGVPVWVKKINQFTDEEIGSTFPGATLPAMQVLDNGDMYAVVQSPIKRGTLMPSRMIKFDSNGDEVWHYEVTGNVNMVNKMPREFVDNNGNVTFLVASTGDVLFNGESLPYETPYASSGRKWLISLDNLGNKKWNTSTQYDPNFFGVHPGTGDIYLLYQYVTSPASTPMAPFSGLSNTSPTPGTQFQWQGVVALTAAGVIRKAVSTYPVTTTSYPLQMQTTTTGRILLSGAFGGGSVFRAGDNFVSLPVNTYGFVGMEVDADFTPISVFKMPSAVAVAVAGNKFASAGDFKTALTIGNTTLTPFNIDTDFNTRFPQYASSKQDIFIAQGNLDNIPLTPENTTWTGTASSDWQNTANWTNGIPTESLRATFGAGTVVFPTNIPASANVGQIMVSSGTELKLSGTYGALTVGDRLFNQGKITAVTSGLFNFFGLKEINGSGEFNINGAAQIFNFNGIIENTLSFDNSISLFSSNFSVNKLKFIGTNAKFAGDIKVNSSAEDAVTIAGPTNFVNGTLTRAINATGNYLFPLAAGYSNERRTTLNFTADNLIGTSFVAAKHTKDLPTNGSGGNPDLLVKGTEVKQLLNGGFLTLTPNNQPTAGTYGLDFSVTGSTNTVTDPLKYVLIKRDNNTSPWVFQGNNTVAPTSTGTGTTAIVKAGLNGLTSFSDFAIGIGNTPITLPVNLIKFTASADAKSAKLYWETASELNNDKFEIERSVNGTDFIKIGEVKGNGTSQKLNVYSFRDLAPANGYNYYRLNQVDLDAKSNYSNVESVNFSISNTDIIIFPNPFVSSLSFKGINVKKAEVTIYNSSGKKVYNSLLLNNNIDIPYNLPAGIYIIKVTENNNTIITRQVFKQ